MIIIYDFDGTLTPFSLPQYSILKQCGYTDETIMARIEKEKSKFSNFYEAYFGCYREILAENGIEMSQRNVCLGAQQVQLNNGVLEYFRRFQSSKTGI